MRKIHTDQLRPGDEIHFAGATIRLDDKPIEVQAPGRNRTLFMWPNARIVKGALDFARTATAYTVMGGRERTWAVSRRSQ